MRKPDLMNDLRGRNILITGVRNEHSIAWHTSLQLIQMGARAIYSCYSEREVEEVRRLAAPLDPSCLVFKCDATQDDQVSSLRKDLEGAGISSLHGLVHAMAFAKNTDLREGVLNTTAESFRLCLETTTFSLICLSSVLRPLLAASGDASILTYTFVGSNRVVPHYNVVGIGKAGLEASVRYLAADLGPSGIRVNAISAGPLRTLSASGIPGFDAVIQEFEHRSALRRNVTTEEVASASCFLLSPAASGITGTILPVDAGFHAMM